MAISLAKNGPDRIRANFQKSIEGDTCSAWRSLFSPGEIQGTVEGWEHEDIVVSDCYLNGNMANQIISWSRRYSIQPILKVWLWSGRGLVSSRFKCRQNVLKADPCEKVWLHKILEFAVPCFSIQAMQTKAEMQDSGVQVNLTPSQSIWEIFVSNLNAGSYGA